MGVWALPSEEMSLPGWCKLLSELRRQRPRPRRKRLSSRQKQGCTILDCRLDSLVVLAKRSAAALLVAVWPTKPERPLRRWRTLSAPVAGTGRQVDNSEQVVELQDKSMLRKLAMASVEEGFPLLETSARDWAEVSWALISSAWTALMLEALMVVQWAPPMTAWLGIWLMAR